MSHRWNRVLTSSTAVLAVTAGLVACGSDPAPQEAPPTTTTTETTTTETPTGHGALAQCLAEHGVPAVMGPAAGPPDGVDQQTWQNAMKDCSTLGPGPAG